MDEEGGAGGGDLLHNISFQTRRTPYAVQDRTNKRKLSSVELELPEAKYKCVELESDCDTTSLLVEAGDEALTADREHAFDASRVDSVKDSNIIADDADTAMSAYFDFNCGNSPAGRKDTAYTSGKWPDRDYPPEMRFTSEAAKEVIMESRRRECNVVFGRHGENSHECGLQMRQMLEEQLLEHGVDLNSGCSEYASAYEDLRINKEAEDCDLTSVLGSTSYALSSGRSSANNETLNSTKRPTIDTEFEEYFSMLMM
ncbi:hypothetical protein MLD38_026516 [Melastoma candidum]|uniref:Uncharacterized protein n=1 Tax=Melastoma candidum TaxID=119954 RepID=A0ACB9P0E5_9MYRT|nr:hypothetical protein MLD38_026516 [Melastoma candidum]